MLDYVPEALTRFQHQALSKPQHQPYPHIKPNYRAMVQYTEDMDTSALLPKEDKKIIQEVIGIFLYYACCVNSTMLAALGSIATQQANPTENTTKKVWQFLDYVATYPDAIVTYHTSDMVLGGHSNALYLSKTKACSRAGRHFFMSSNTAKPLNNGTILTITQIIKVVMSSAAEAEVGALYINCREAISTRHTLKFMGHPQPPTPMQTDNTTALSVVNKNVIKKLKAMNMKYHWLCDRECRGQFWHYWAPGKENNGNYVTKHHATIHHQATRPTFLTNIPTLQALRQQLNQQLTGNLTVARVC
jgi:hypothetical protein